MSTLNERERHVKMLRAALPYVPPENRHTMEILLQAGTLINLISNDNALEMSSISEDEDSNSEPFQSNPEAMLMNIREFCTPKENDTIQVLLNFIHADKLFRNYKDFAHTHPGALEASELNTSTTTPLNILFQLINGIGSLSGNLGKTDHSGKNYIMEFLMSQLSPEQRSTFEQVQNLMAEK